ncbi:hypothetical protein RvY_11895 [Ramazzottius varieornatus]|uniref:MD-2-related lipid-recognition domain-containing protein n=1 Tax=Ramazzottius varieornatus TaxID=947166 RepID=A0A1D1VRF3_RAMVA|nr:hypothetical protein RvY_11895 [Ramazzottius varieornatus]
MASSPVYLFTTTFYVLSTTCGLSLATTIPFKDCGTQNGKVLKVDITPCASDPCEFSEGQNVTAEIDFMITEQQVSQATLAASATIFGRKIRLPVPQPDVCLISGVICPLKSGVIYKMVDEIDVPRGIPSLRAKIPLEVTLTGFDEQFFLCGTIDVIVG